MTIVNVLDSQKQLSQLILETKGSSCYLLMSKTADLLHLASRPSGAHRPRRLPSQNYLTDCVVDFETDSEKRTCQTAPTVNVCCMLVNGCLRHGKQTKWACCRAHIYRLVRLELLD